MKIWVLNQFIFSFFLCYLVSLQSYEEKFDKKKEIREKREDEGIWPVSKWWKFKMNLRVFMVVRNQLILLKSKKVNKTLYYITIKFNRDKCEYKIQN